jgi:ribonuclease HI
MWMQVQYGPYPQGPDGWWAATDGSAAEGAAGWGVVVFRWHRERGAEEVPSVVLHGPVMTQAWDHRWMGARESTNHTGELCAIGELMWWALHAAPDQGASPIHVRYDSEYAANIARGVWRAVSNEELAVQVKELVDEVRTRRVVTWEWVNGHSGAHDNELADRAADQGRMNRVSTMTSRWLAPPPALAALSWRDTDFCKKCGLELLTKDIGWHMRRCQVAPWAVPEGWSKCRLCKELVKGARSNHEAKCRGSALANRTCSKCGTIFDPPPEGQLSRPLGNHEKRCQGGTAEGGTTGIGTSTGLCPGTREGQGAGEG